MENISFIIKAVIEEIENIELYTEYGFDTFSLTIDPFAREVHAEFFGERLLRIEFEFYTDNIMKLAQTAMVELKYAIENRLH